MVPPKWRCVFLHRRVEIIAATGETPRVSWDLGQTHILCQWPAVAASTATPGRWWRWHARQALESLVEAAGGVAWDYQGNVGYAPPSREAWQAAESLLARICQEVTGRSPPPSLARFVALGNEKIPTEAEVLRYLGEASKAKKAFEGLQTWGFLRAGELEVNRRNPETNNYDIMEKIRVPSGWDLLTASFPVEKAESSSEDKTSEEEDA